MPDLTEGSNLYYNGDRRIFVGSSPTTMRDLLTRQLETELYRPLYEALKQGVPSERLINGCISHAITIPITKFEVGAD